jgi:hypothetical protein
MGKAVRRHGRLSPDGCYRRAAVDDEGARGVSHGCFKTETQHAQEQIEKERGNEAARRQTEQLAGVGREGIRQAATASKSAAEATLNSGSAIADGAQEITAAWTRYAEEVMRHTSEASKALLRARTFPELLEVQANLLRNNMQAFMDQSTRIAGAASRMAMGPFEALRYTKPE